MYEGRLRWLAASRRAVDTLLAESKVEPGRMLRHLVASARPCDLCVWQHALDSGALEALGERAQIGQLLVAAASRFRPVASLECPALEALSRAGEPSVAELAPLAAGSWPICAMLVEGAPDQDAAKVLSCFIQGATAPRGATGRPLSRDVWRRVIVQLSTLVAKRPKLKLGLADFEAIPDEIRRTIKFETSVLSARGVAERQQRLRRAQRIAANVALRIDRRSKALSDAIDRLLNAAANRANQDWRTVARELRALAASCAHPASSDDVKSREERIVTRLVQRRSVWPLLQPAPTRVISAMQRTQFGYLAPMLAFLAAPRAMQCRREWGVRWPSLSVANCKPLIEQIASAAAALYSKPSRGGCRVRISAMRAWGPHRWPACASAWDTAFTAPRKLHAASDDDPNAVITWVQQCSDASFATFQRQQATWIRSNLARSSFLAAVLAPGFERAAIRFVLAGEGAWLDVAWKTLTQARTSRRAPTRRLLELLQASGSRAVALSVAARGPAAFGIARTLQVLGAKLDGECLGSIIRSGNASKAVWREVQRLLRDASAPRFRRLHRSFRMLLASPELRDAEVAGLLWRDAMEGGSLAACTLLRENPAVFRPYAERDLSPEDVTAISLLSAISRQSSECGIPGATHRARLMAALPTVRKMLAKRPGMLAIAELAAFSDIREVPLLCVLAGEASAARDAPRGTRFDDRYRVYTVPKRSGGTRTITVPDNALKSLQRKLLAGAFEPIPLHDAAHGFRAGRSIVTNASAHVGRKLIVNVDIKGFFPNTRYQSVLSACCKVDGGAISAPAALLLADICCFDGALPTGAPTSPAIGNIVLRRADRAIAAAAAKHGVSYTRYADDLTFSDDGSAKRILPFVRRVLGDCGYEIDDKKTHLYRRGRQQLVTNLVVNERPNLRRSDRRRLRAAVDHRCRGHDVRWHGKEMDDAALQGRLALLAMVDAGEAAAHRARLKAQAANWGGRRD
jgi:hypothetical protein